MKILAVGGGSGGHVTPVVAVLKEIKQTRPRAEIRFWSDFAFARQAASLVGDFDASIPISRIVAGKFRRYHHLSVLQQLLWVRLVLLNIRDAFLVGVGFVQSFVKLVIWRPDVVFTKGGYVCLPVGMAARVLRIPLVIHDSDAHPGLTNRILGKWADAIATGAPLEYYHYPPAISRYVGIPISPDFHPYTKIEIENARARWGIDPDQPLIVITGGGLGAQRINDAVAQTVDDLMELGTTVLISGSAQYDELRALTPEYDDRFQLHAFVSKGMAQLLGAADVVVTRAGATTILELAALAKPTILVPNGKLTGGHQLKNAKVYVDADALTTVDEELFEDDPQLLVRAVKDVLSHPDEAAARAKRFAAFARPQAARDVADMIISAAK